METSEQAEVERGLVCPRCGCRHFWVTNTYRDERKIRRRRVCRHCLWVKYSTERWAVEEEYRRGRSNG